jgi:hypothetical protein
MTAAGCQSPRAWRLGWGLPAVLALLTVLVAPAVRGRQEPPELSRAVRIELLRLEETYHVLDRTAAGVWPGWNNYRDFPFLFNFENGLRVLVGHPNPPEGFTPIPDLRVAGKQVWVDSRKVEPLRLEQPLYSGGGISSFGTLDGKPVTVIEMTLNRSRPREDGGAARFRTENAILTYVHELFHCFQQDHVFVPYPNFRYNPDTSFAAYSEVEGAALEKAYAAGSREESIARLKDFLIARRLKRKDMSEFDRSCESADEVREGTAVYSEVRSLELLGAGFSPVLTPLRDPYYGGFKNIEPLLQRYRDRLRRRKAQTYSYLKCYEYGCFEALLLERLFPGWQAPFSEKPHFLDEEIARRIPLTPGDERGAEKRFDEVYGFRRVRARHGKAVEERNAAYEAISARDGRSYIISFKPIHQYVSALVGAREKSYEVGLMKIFPRGVGTVRSDEIEVRFKKAPVVINQLYYFKAVDTDWTSRRGPYVLRYEKREGEDVFCGATLTTPLFELKAPRIRIREDAKRVKIWILSRVG